MNGYIAVFEILGFKSFIQQNSIEDKIATYSEFISAISEGLQALKNNWLEDKEYKLLKINTGNGFIIWTVDETPVAFGQLVVAAASLLSISLFAGFPLRGYVNYGNMLEISHSNKDPLFINSPLFLGTGLYHSLENIKWQKWSGCVVSDAAVSAYNRQRSDYTVTIAELLSQKIISKYPYLNGSKEKMNIVINWINGIKEDIPSGLIRFAFLKHNKPIEDDAVQEKLNNTIRFVQYIKSPSLN